MKINFILIVTLSILTLGVIKNISTEIDIRTIEKQYPACKWETGAPYYIGE
ncbi:MAG: hypothetical protein GY861_16685 [bacterium]|nr:hypothetical protein [bacterium]